jgi:hypothetical protein
LGITHDYDKEFDDVLIGATVHCSSVANDPVHLPERILDGTEEAWVSHPGVE